MLKISKGQNRKQSILLLGILFVSLGLYSFFFAIEANFHEVTESEHNSLTFKPKPSASTINITTPENKTYLSPMSGYYPASFSFENDIIGSDPMDWSVYEVGGTVNVIDFLGNHKKVVEVHNNALDHTRLTNYFTDITIGTIELWVRTNTIIDESIVLRAGDGPTTDELLISVNSITNKWEYYDAGTWYDMPADVTADTWYHIRIEFDCTDDWHVWIDGVSQDGGTGFGYRGSPTQMDKFTFGTTTQATEVYAYFDAVGYSWDPNYKIGDNLDEGLLLSYENSTILVWQSYSLDGEANKTILGNTTLSIPTDGVHTIQVFGNDSLGIMYQSNIRFFTYGHIQDSILPPSIPGYNIITVTLISITGIIVSLVSRRKYKS